MRIRSVKPEFWRSPDVTSLSIEDRLLFIGIWSYVDDNGVGVDRLGSIAGDLFADDLERDPRETLARVSGGLSNLASAGRIVRYEVDGRRYLEVVNWSKHQRIDKPGKPRFPGSDQAERVFAESSRDPRDTLAESPRLEQGNRGTGEQGNRGTDNSSSSATTEFERAWQHWPKKVEKKKALEKFKVKARRIGAVELAAHVTRFGDAYAATTERQFVPNLASWLNGERWTDELPTSCPQRRSTFDENLAEFHRLYGGSDEQDGGPRAAPRSISA
ncbi:hypothetical protein JRG19_02435 [Pseudoclavibacter alba]|uniref:hypothetical protein n=1 Tax=Pseudoclavibacter albus TaxID=272241 RepID=UPI0019CF66EE|nr:hypothetical protein [Pseudoclavibacter alba]MBN6777408.1 hypothetical protein [Pseudoclavibacter alba]